MTADELRGLQWLLSSDRAFVDDDRPCGVIDTAMCNKFRNQLPFDFYAEAGEQMRAPLREPRFGIPNLEPREISITEPAPILRAAEDGARELRLDLLRWSWPGPGGKPVYNFRSDGRRFPTGRCLIPADGFYEFTDPEPPAPKRARKTKWLFTVRGETGFAIAGVWRDMPKVAGAAAFAMLTCPPGDDIAPYHDRQVVVLHREDWAGWLFGDDPEVLLRPAPAGTLIVERVV